MKDAFASFVRSMKFLPKFISLLNYITEHRTILYCLNEAVALTEERLQIVNTISTTPNEERQLWQLLKCWQEKQNVINNSP